MTLETFFEKFDHFADAPDAVVKMRELVLELAVRGRLLSSYSPDSSDKSDPASPFAIPQDWQWIALNKAADCRAAAKVDATSLNDSDWVLDLEDIDGGAGKVIATATFAERRSLSTKASFQKGDVLYGKLRPYLNKVVIADRPGFCTTEIIPLRPQKFAAAGYLRLFLRSPHFLRYASAKNYGMKMPRLGTQDLESAAIPLPPLAEQKRILAKVDELMALCDRLALQQQERETRHAALARASLSRFADAPTPANLPFIFHPSCAIPPIDLRKSILTLAVQGKLVPQDPNDERPQIPSDGQTVGDSEWVSRLQLPDTWLWARFESLLAVLKNGFNGKPSKVVGKFKITRIETISRETVDLARVGYADDLPCDVAAKHAVLKGDILFSHINSEPHLGKTAICTIDDPSLVHGVNLLLLRPIAGIDSRYLNIALRELRAAGYFVSIAQRAVNQASINQKNLGKTPIPIPPLAEQRRIVAKVEQMMALVDALETQLAASRATAANLLSALVAELTGTPHTGKVSVPSGTGRRGRPRKSA